MLPVDVPGKLVGIRKVTTLPVKRKTSWQWSKARRQMLFRQHAAYLGARGRHPAAPGSAMRLRVNRPKNSVSIDFLPFFRWGQTFATLGQNC